MKPSLRVLVYIAVVTLFVSCQGPVTNTVAAGGLRLGMSRADFGVLYPDSYQDAGNPDRFIRNDSVFGLPGRWVYHFSENKLSWFVFNASQHDISRQSFEQYLKVAEELSRTYDSEYGKAIKVRKGIQDFKDPSEASHNGYMVQQSSWETPEGRRTVEFTFLGDHKNYSLLLTIQVGQ